jgi:hypothetical protein
MLVIYDRSLAKFLNDAYNGEYEWVDWLFQLESVPMGFWKQLKNQLAFFDWVMKERKMQSLEDWYSVSVADIRGHGGSSHSASELLVTHAWRSELFFIFQVPH